MVSWILVIWLAGSPGSEIRLGGYMNRDDCEHDVVRFQHRYRVANDRESPFSWRCEGSNRTIIK